MHEVRKMLKAALPSDIYEKVIILMDRRSRHRAGGQRKGAAQ